MQNQKIILAAPPHFGFGETIKKELVKQGFDVLYISSGLDVPFRYKNIFQRAHNFLRKVFLRDKSFKNKLRKKFELEKLENELKNENQAHYALFIRPDMYPLEFISKVQQIADKLVAYQWDGIERFPQVQNYISLFDYFHVFDRSDLNKFPSTKPCTNFYFPLPLINRKNIPDTYYVGTFSQDRFNLLLNIKDSLDQLNIKSTITLSTESVQIKNLIQNKGFHSAKKNTTYEENLNNITEFGVLIDIQNTIHDGLSFRVFEAIGYDKKLITTNSNIKKYDFYNPSNILVWDDQSKEEISAFYNTAYEPVPEIIKQKYSFENWLKYVLKIEGHIPIDVPS